MKRAFKVALTLFVVVLVAIVLILNSFGGRLIQKTVNVAGPAALGVPVSLEKAEFHLLRGHVLLKGLTVGNPDGFKTDGIFELGQLTVDLNTRSLLSGVVHIRKILIDAPKITYERGLTSSNLGDLLAGLEKKPDPAGEETPVVEEAPADEAGGVKVVIDELVVSDAQLNVSLTVAQGLSAPLPLPTITLRDIGKETGGAGFMEVIQKVLGAILGAVTDVIKGSAKLLGDGAALVGDGALAVGGAAVDGAAAVGGVAVDGVKAVGQGAAVVGGAAVDGAAAVGGAAVDGAAAVGGVAVDGVKAVGKGVGAVGGAVVDGIGGLFGGGDKGEAKAETPAE
jgi:uncharacterized protein involved in outer membrane biogenesis